MILLHIKKNYYNQNTDEDSNNLSTSSIKNCKTSENNVIITTEAPNNNDVINDDLSKLTQKKKFPNNSAPFNSVQLKPNLIKEKTLLQQFANFVHLLVLKPLVVNHLV